MFVPFRRLYSSATACHDRISGSSCAVRRPDKGEEQDGVVDDVFNRVFEFLICNLEAAGVTERAQAAHLVGESNKEATLSGGDPHRLTSGEVQEGVRGVVAAAVVGVLALHELVGSLTGLLVQREELLPIRRLGSTI